MRDEASKKGHIKVEKSTTERKKKMKKVCSLMPKTTERTMTTTHFTPNFPKSLSYLEELIDYQNHKMCMKAN